MLSPVLWRFKGISMLRLLSGLVLFVLVAFPTWAQADVNAPGVKFVQAMSNEAVAKLTDKTIDDKEREARLRSLLKKYFDLDGISKFILGRHHKAATEAQLKQFAQLFEDFNVLTWTTRFRDYGGETVEIVSTSPRDENGFITVESKFTRAQPNPPIFVTWRLSGNDDNLKVYDILAEGVSMAMTQKSDYGSVLQRSKMEGLLEVMQDKVNKIREADAKK